MIPCPECGRPADPQAAACPNCGHALATGTVPPVKSAAETLPPEVSSWVIQKTPPEMIEELRRAFNEEDYLAEVRQTERPGGVKFEEIIGEIEEVVKRGH